MLTSPMEAVVATRLRPFSQKEKDAGEDRTRIRIDKGNRLSITDAATGKQKKFNSFDFSFNSHSTDGLASAVGFPYASQEDVYNEFGKPAVAEFLAGRNTCVFAYGQTGTGKSYSIWGPDDMEGGASTTPTTGLLPRTCAHLFDPQWGGVQSVDLEVLEVYCNEIGDLQCPRRKWPRGGYKMMFKETGCHTVDDVVTKTCTSAAELIAAALKAKNNRPAGNNKAHVIYRLSAAAEVKEGFFDAAQREKQFTFFDLAGSENMAGMNHLAAGIQEIKEKNCINISLSAFGSCLNALQNPSQAKAKRPKFRECQLTLLLQSALGSGRNAAKKFFFLALLNPSGLFFGYEETMSTLSYADGVKFKPAPPSILPPPTEEELAAKSINKGPLAATGHAKNPDALDLVVGVRIRPLNLREKESGNERRSVLHIIKKSEEEDEGEGEQDSGRADAVYIENPDSGDEKSFKFACALNCSDTDGAKSHIGVPFASPEDVYTQFAKSAVDECLSGHDTTVIASGESTSEKAITIFKQGGDQEGEGLLAKSCHDIFQQKALGGVESVQLQVVEIYCEQVNDLLAERKTWPPGGHKPKRLPSGNFALGDAIVVKSCESEADLMGAVNSAHRNRSTSSEPTGVEYRSHVIYRILVQTLKGDEQSQGEEDAASLPTELNFVELVGSEMGRQMEMSRSGSGRRASSRVDMEGNAINLSLTALGNCLKSRHSGVKVLYRESKLLLVLQRAFSARKCFLLAHVAPSENCYDETMRTLRFADRIRWPATVRIPKPPADEPSASSPTNPDPEADPRAENKDGVDKNASPELTSPVVAVPLTPTPPVRTELVLGTRLRPFLPREKEAGEVRPQVRIEKGNRLLIADTNSGAEREFNTFDHVFNSHSIEGVSSAVGSPYVSQEGVYEEFGKPAVTEFLSGYNTCVFAYGESKSGRTHSLLGAKDVVGGEGLILRSARDIFTQDATVDLQVLEVRCEMVNDLLTDRNQWPPNGHKPKLTDSMETTIVTKSCSSADELMAFVDEASKNRPIEQVLSHHQLRHEIYVLSATRDGKTTRLNFVNLAGNERMEVDAGELQRLRESNAVALSLGALSNCLTALLQGKKRAMYRESKLTLLLQHSLGFSRKIFILSHLNPSGRFGGGETTMKTLVWSAMLKAAARVKNEEDDAISKKAIFLDNFPQLVVAPPSTEDVIEERVPFVQMAVRMAPFNRREKKAGFDLSPRCVRFGPTTNIKAKIKQQQETGDSVFLYSVFLADHVTNMEKEKGDFDFVLNSHDIDDDGDIGAPYASQEEVFNQVGQPMVDQFTTGDADTSLFVYGQQGSGKTYSLRGDGDGELGLIHQCLRAIFAQGSISLKVQAVEICCDVLQDLRIPPNSRPANGYKPKLGPDGIYSWDTVSMSEPCTSVQEVEEVINKEVDRNVRRFTIDPNEKHRLHIVYQFVADRADGTQKRLSFVELANSDREESDAAEKMTHEQKREAHSINLSLTSLGNTLKNLHQDKRAFYRDCNLLLYLQRPLVQAKIAMKHCFVMAHVRPAALTHDETLSTLRYASRVCAPAPPPNEDGVPEPSSTTIAIDPLAEQEERPPFLHTTLRVRSVMNQREKDSRMPTQAMQFKEENVVLLEDPKTEEQSRFNIQANCCNPDGTSTQEEVFDAVGKPMLEQFLNNDTDTCCIAYGAVGSGKRLSIFGRDFGRYCYDQGDESAWGLMPRCLKEVFTQEKSKVVKVRAVEVHCEQLQDLLVPRKDWPTGGHKAKMDKTGMVYPTLTTSDPCSSVEDAMQLVHRADNLRTTHFNGELAPSHAVYSFFVERGDRTQKELTFVHLFDSVPPKTTAGTTGQYLKENNAVNLSFAALRRVLKTLSEGKRAQFRESKLTLMLDRALRTRSVNLSSSSVGSSSVPFRPEDSNKRCFFLATLSPSAMNFTNTTATLKFVEEIANLPVPEEPVEEDQNTTGKGHDAEAGASVLTPNRALVPTGELVTPSLVSDISASVISEQQLRLEFDRYDVNRNGYLERPEFKKVYLKEFEHFGHQPSDADIDRAFTKYSSGGGADSKITFEEFSCMMLARANM